MGTGRPVVWREGKVNSQGEHIQLSYGRWVSTDLLAPIALVAPTQQGGEDQFTVEFLPVSHCSSKRLREMREEVRRELDFYLVELNEKFPWQYAISHCGTVGDAPSDVHWRYCPNGDQRRGDRGRNGAGAPGRRAARPRPGEKPPDTRDGRRQVFIGDIHGDLHGFREILEHAGLIDSSVNWAGGSSVLVQTGDVIDRGPLSVESVALLRTLQDQAPGSGGEVLRLCGNHELTLLQGCYGYANFKNKERLRAELAQEIADGRLQAAYTDGRWLCTHAGMRSVVRRALCHEIRGGKTSPEGDTIDLHTLAEHINMVFRNAVREQFPDHHVILWVGPERGGSDPVGGIFWCDSVPLSASEEAWTVPQIFGHTPTFESNVKHAWDLHLIDIDAGLYKSYGGNPVYLEIDAQGRITQHSGKWEARTLRGASGTENGSGGGEPGRRRRLRSTIHRS